MTLAGVTSDRWNNLTVKFELLPKGIEGSCATNFNTVTMQYDLYTIRIAAYWMIWDEARREQLMYHELGHCILGLRHNNNVVNSIPESIMNWQNFKGSIYSSNYASYLAELFNVNPAVFAGVSFDSSQYSIVPDTMLAPEDITGHCGNEH
jgi:hypothetical protein